MSGGSSISRRPAYEKSNVELVNSLRSNFIASKEAYAIPATGAEDHHRVDGDLDYPKDVWYTQWTSTEDGWLHIPTNALQTPGLAEERSSYDITVKLFFLPGTCPSGWGRHAQEALDSVLKELDIQSVDLLIVSFPGLSFDSDGKQEERSADCGEISERPKLSAMVKAWRDIEAFKSNGTALRIGIAEFGGELLKDFLPKTKIRPSVDQISLRDSGVVPGSMIAYAKQEKIELLTHSDCTNILPQGTVRELLGNGKNGAGVLAGPEESNGALKGDVQPQWVVKYTAVVRDRGVIENKGYFASADLIDD
ncbi:MAG: hypothetical protein LQ351_008146 [Letrouitia transgressa]|nr:MAG: hypothetical protein LQ351_008146 [Letrouitia transgressa]